MATLNIALIDTVGIAVIYGVGCNGWSTTYGKKRNKNGDGIAESGWQTEIET